MQVSSSRWFKAARSSEAHGIRAMSLLDYFLHNYLFISYQNGPIWSSFEIRPKQHKSQCQRYHHDDDDDCLTVRNFWLTEILGQFEFWGFPIYIFCGKENQVLFEFTFKANFGKWKLANDITTKDNSSLSKLAYLHLFN